MSLQALGPQTAWPFVGMMNDARRMTDRPIGEGKSVAAERLGTTVPAGTAGRRGPDLKSMQRR